MDNQTPNPGSTRNFSQRTARELTLSREWPPSSSTPIPAESTLGTPRGDPDCTLVDTLLNSPYNGA